MASRFGVIDRDGEVSLGEEPSDFLSDHFLERFRLGRRSPPRIGAGTIVHHRLGPLHGAGGDTLSVRVVFLVEAEPVVGLRSPHGLPWWAVVELDPEAHHRLHILGVGINREIKTSSSKLL